MKYCPKCSQRFDDLEAACPYDGFELSAFDRYLGAVVDGKYRIDALLGSGAMGAVYLATQLNLGRSVAIKVIRDDVSVSEVAVERMKREAGLIARLKHRNIVTVYDAGSHPGVGVYTVMEHLEGSTLADEIKRRGRLSPGRALDLMLQACAAVHAAHTVGIIHRDLKPGNIFLESSPAGHVVKVLDFGVAKLDDGSTTPTASLTAEGTMVGTPLYMSPEQCSDLPLDARTDVYALGCVLYEMLTGRPPFTGRTISAILVKHMKEPPEPPSRLVPGLPRQLDDIVLRALAKSPSARPQTAADLAAELAALGESAAAFTLADAEPDPGDSATTLMPNADSLGHLRLTPHNLPHAATSFGERVRAISEIRDLLSTARLATVVGPAGPARTQLAGQVASELLEAFPDGVWLVEVAPLSNAGQLPRAVASVLGLPSGTGGGPLGALAQSIRGKRVLLVLDGCDHLAEATSLLVEELLAACPDLCVLATTAHPLGVAGEAVYRPGAAGAERHTAESPGETRSAPASTTGAVAAPSRRRWLLAACAAAIAVVVAVVALLPTRTRSFDSIAIIPFANASGDPQMEYLGDGIAESIINELAQLPNLRVLARTTVFQYKGRPVDLASIGRELNVGALLTGRVVERGDTVTIQVDLVDVGTGAQIWGQQYTRKLSDVLAIQEEIAREVSERLSVRLSGDDRRRLAKHLTENNEAYQLYLQGRYSLAKQTQPEWERAVDAFNRAVAADPGYALAYAGLADAYIQASNVSMQPAEAMAKAKQAAMQALALDDGLAEAHTALGQVNFWYEWDWARAEREFRRATELNPGYAFAHYSYGFALVAFGRFDEGIAEMQIAQRLDPLSVPLNRDIGSAFLFARQYDRATAQYRRVLELDPQGGSMHSALGTVYVLTRRFDQAIAEFEAIEEGDSDTQRIYLLGYAYAAAGNRDAALERVRQLDALAASGRYLPQVAVARIYAALGDNDRTFEWLEKAYDSRADSLIWLEVDPRFDPVRADPRFADLLRRMRRAG